MNPNEAPRLGGKARKQGRACSARDHLPPATLKCAHLIQDTTGAWKLAVPGLTFAEMLQTSMF